MEWPLGISVQDRRFVAEVLTADGKAELRGLESLATIDMFGRRKTRHWKGVTTSIPTWNRVSPDEYLSAVGVTLPAGVESRHQVFEFVAGSIRYVVPGLALMKALFQPENVLLPWMFGGQGIERACFIDLSATPPKVRQQTHWSGKSNRGFSEGVQQRLQWMSCFPSARRMTGSVHGFALGGIIGTSLPSAEIYAAVHGIMEGQTCYVTRLNINCIKALEEPFEFFPEQSREFALNPLPHEFNAPCDVPLDRDGQTRLSAYEWELVAPALLEKMNPRRLILDQRLIFEDILKKIHLNAGWKTLEYQVGTWVHASRAYNLWRKQGTFFKAMDLLTELRRTSSAEL